MQEIQYRDHEGLMQKSREFFGGQTYKEVQAKMASRLSELEGEVEVVSMRRERIGRNDACPCGSGRKFKKCCIDNVK